MKSKLLSLLMLLTVAINYGQSSANVAGIAIQGIARDNNNTARTSATISLTFRIYYGSNVAIYEVTRTVTTDAFGVFSAVLEPGETNNIVIANTQAYLRISEGSTTISDEKLKQVPYAIAATNGVPTGSIMPFVGTTAPIGWLMCDGSAIPSDASGTALIAILGGNSTPDLRGLFLRGAGKNTNYAEIDANTLKGVQGSDNKSHNHDGSPLKTETAGRHTHEWKYSQETDNSGIGTAFNEFTMNPNGTRIPNPMNDAGDHTHTVSGSTGNSGGSESRPINYGVNYIIKL